MEVCYVLVFLEMLTNFESHDLMWWIMLATRWWGNRWDLHI